ncbi:AAA family ATPase [Amycolatopsis sp. CA-128772]|uniref:AAA family ATPase n=1 Tax=Amycolatopsis sp. CA-128772 TaxID=2073159 RepID=UPI000CD22337|nr:LuxR family transcriptional regulator [Amycolatopsis sp. CA-128772]
MADPVLFEREAEDAVLAEAVRSLGGGTAARRTGDHAAAQQTSRHTSTQQPSGHTATRRPGGHAGTQQPSEHTATQQTSEHTTTHQPGEHTATRQTGEHTATQPPGGVVVVRGEAGAGRSALLRRLGRLAADGGARVLRAAGAPAERDLPFGVVRQLFLPLLDDPCEATLPPIAGKLLRSLAGAAPDDACATLLHGLHVLLVSLAAHQPVVVLADDLRWADEPSVRALAFLAGRLRGTRILLGVALPGSPRTPALRDIARATAYEVCARPLSADGTRRVVAARTGAEPDPAFAAACQELTGGRARDLDELLSRAFAHRLAGTAAHCAPLRELGAAARRERLRLLVRREPEVAALARAVVTLGRHAEPGLVARLAGLDGEACAEARTLLGDAWLSTAADGRLVPEPALVRVVEQMRTGADAGAAHRAAAALLAAQGFPPEHVAAQLMGVDTLSGREDVATLRTAAVAAQRRGAADLAARYLRRALLDLPPGKPGRARLLTELAAAEADPRAAVRYLVQAVPLLPAGRARAEAVARIPLTAAARGPLVTELVKTVPRPDDPELAMRLEARDWFAALEEPARLAAAAGRLRQLPDRPRGPGDRELRAVLLLAATLGGHVTAAEAARHAGVLLEFEPARTVRAGTALRIVPLVLIAAGRPGAVTSWLAAADRPRLTTSARVLVDVHQALALLARGRFADAAGPAERAFRAAEPGGYDVLALPATTLALVAEAARRRDLARQVLEGLPGTDDLAVFAVRRGMRGMLATREEPDAALAQFLDRGRLLDRAGWRNPAIHPWRGSAALLARRLGRTGEARQLAEEHHRHSVAWGAPAPVGRSLRVLAALADRRRAVELLREAVELLDGAPDELEAAKAYADLGTRLRETEPAAARRLLARAQELATACGAGRLEAREDGTIGHAPPARTTAELTAGEATVGRLAAAGRTNAEIAEELGISRRAVEKHLTSLYRKLKIDGRAELATSLG